jgi:hypothetical protein
MHLTGGHFASDCRVSGFPGIAREERADPGMARNFICAAPDCGHQSPTVGRNDAPLSRWRPEGFAEYFGSSSPDGHNRSETLELQSRQNGHPAVS